MQRTRHVLAWLLVAPWAAWALVRIAGLGGGFPLVQLLAFTPYALPLAVVGGVLAALLRHPAPAAVALATVVALAVVIAPRAIGDDGGHTGVRLRVMTANLHYGDVPPRMLIDLVRRERVDVLAVQELTPLEAGALSRAGLPALLPYSKLRARTGGDGTAVYARVPLESLAPPPETAFAMTATAVRVPGTAPVRLLSVHTLAPHDRGATSRWADELDALPGPGKSGPVQLLAGDFNATLDHPELRDLLGRGYRDAAERAGAGLRPTWRGGIAPPITLDHVLAPAPVAVSSVSVHRLPSSDHRALVVELGLPRVRPGARTITMAP